MRISSQNITQNTINAIKSQITPSEAKAMIGTIIEGRITLVQGQQLATLTTGDKQLNVNINGLNLQDNQLVNLKVTGFKDGALIAKLVSSAMPTDSNNSLTEMLSKLGISDQAENITIIDAMKTANIPITKDNFQLMRQGMSEVKALISELSTAGQRPLENDLEMPIKALALKIMQESGKEGKANTQANLLANHQANPQATPQATTQATTHTNPQANSLGNAANTTTISQSALIAQSNIASSPSATELEQKTANSPIDIEAGDDLQQQAKKMDLEMISKTIQLAFDKQGLSLKQGIQALLSQFDYKQESLIIKNDLPITLKNIFLAYDALSEEGGITNRFSDVLKGLEAVPFSKEAILNIATALTSDVPQEEKLETLLDAIRKELPDSEIRQGLERELSVIKESSTLNRSLNDQMMFMQMPIPINEQLQNVDIYYKKNKTKPDPDDLTLLIALKTFNFGEVRCVVNKQKQSFTLNFSFVDETSMAYFESKKEQLTAALATHKDKQFTLNFTVKSTLPEFQIQENNAIESFGFDLKV